MQNFLPNIRPKINQSSTLFIYLISRSSVPFLFHDRSTPGRALVTWPQRAPAHKRVRRRARSLQGATASSLLGRAPLPGTGTGGGPRRVYSPTGSAAELPPPPPGRAPPPVAFATFPCALIPRSTLFLGVGDHFSDFLRTLFLSSLFFNSFGSHLINVHGNHHKFAIGTALS
jgi:hypothetical protein